MTKIEKTLGIAAIILVLLKFAAMPGAGLLLIITLTLLCMFYFSCSFAIFNGISFRGLFDTKSYQNSSFLKIIGAVVTGLVLSATIVGIVFKLFSWPGAHVMLLLGILGIMIITIIVAKKHSKIKSEYYKRIFKRIAIFGFISVFLILLPQSIWIEFQHRNNPEYLQALKQSLADPENEELSQKRDLEYKKMTSGVESSIVD